VGRPRHREQIDALLHEINYPPAPENQLNVL